MAQSKPRWQKVSFSSTLYLYPIIDLLISQVHHSLHNEIRLGLQEALVNAATHGNALNPGKAITVEYCQSSQGYCWVITDQGDGFENPISLCQGKDLDCPDCISQWFPPDEAENGRGLAILLQVFDQVHWNANGTQLRLSKKVPRRSANLIRHFFTERSRFWVREGVGA
jgi:anti-sigma regulatory factor (Ser/Thr protein kinase)